MKQNTNNLFLLGITITATLGGLLFGYDTAVISGAEGPLKSFFITPLLSNHDAASSVITIFKTVGILSFLIIYTILLTFIKKLFITPTKVLINSILLGVFLYALVYYLFLRHGSELNESLINTIHGFNISSALIGCIIGGSLGGYVSQSIGRKKGLIIAASLFLVSAIGSAMPDRMNFLGTEVLGMFMIYRIIGGIGVGLASMISPMYIAEIAPANIRGRLVSYNQFAIIFGMLIVYFVNYFIAKGQTQEWINSVGWRWMFASEVIPASLFMFFLFFVPETPRYLMYLDKDTQAMGILNRIVGPQKSIPIFNEIRKSLVEKNAPWLSFGKIIIIVGIFLSVFQQFVGINVVLYYAPAIFKSIGAKTDSALLQTIIVGAINLIFTVIAIMTVDKVGRKPLQIIGALGMMVGMIGLGMVFYLQIGGASALIFILLYVASFAMSWGPVTWVLLSEIFPNSIKGVMAIAVAAQWLANLIVSTTFPMMNDSTWLTERFHNGFAYWIYGIMSLLAAVFVWKFVPETKGKTLEEIEFFWKKKK